MKRLVLLTVLAGPLAVFGQPMPPVDGLLPDSGKSGVPTIQAAAAVSGGAMQAMLAVPADYSDGILLVTGKAGAPNPRRWEVFARQNRDDSTLKKFVVARGHILQNVLCLDPTIAMRGSDYVNPDRIRVDSAAAYGIALQAASKSGVSVASADFSLRLPQKDTDAVWTLTCRDARGRQLGKIDILATDGTVVSQSGFRPH